MFGRLFAHDKGLRKVLKDDFWGECSLQRSQEGAKKLANTLMNWHSWLENGAFQVDVFPVDNGIFQRFLSSKTPEGVLFEVSTTGWTPKSNLCQFHIILSHDPYVMEHPQWSWWVVIVKKDMHAMFRRSTVNWWSNPTSKITDWLCHHLEHIISLKMHSEKTACWMTGCL